MNNRGTLTTKSGKNSTLATNSGKNSTLATNSGKNSTLATNSGKNSTLATNSGKNNALTTNSGKNNTLTANKGNDSKKKMALTFCKNYAKRCQHWPSIWKSVDVQAGRKRVRAEANGTKNDFLHSPLQQQQCKKKQCVLRTG